jgi:tRNA 5-methylaminomethyl-2-thiouridine biosynthesis bifunctional protein
MQSKPPTTPWDIATPVTTSPQQIAIIGAGIAGAQVARQLAERGCRVRVFDAARIATGASCQSQGITYTRVSHKFGKLPDFAGLSFVHAVDTYQQLMDQGELEADKQVQLNGYLQLVKGSDQQANFEAVLSDPQGHATLLSGAEATEKAGVKIGRSAVFFPTGGWLDLPELCQTLLKHKNITVIENTGALTLRPSIGQSWLLVDSEERIIAQESQVVLATAHDTDKQVDLDWLPLQPIRGQTSLIDVSNKTDDIAVPICHEGYIAPARGGQHCIGASYHPNNDNREVSQADHAHNIDQLQRALGQLFDETGITITGGSAAIRCATADYLPIIGFAPIRDRFRETFAPLAQDRKKIVDAQAPAHPGLWLCCGFGSRGLSATPIAASLLVSQMFDEPPPLPRYLQQAVSPARFLQRVLVKGNRS